MYKYDESFNRIPVSLPSINKEYTNTVREDFSFPGSGKLKKMSTLKLVALVIIILLVLALIVYFIRRYMKNKESKEAGNMAFKYY